MASQKIKWTCANGCGCPFWRGQKTKPTKGSPQNLKRKMGRKFFKKSMGQRKKTFGGWVVFVGGVGSKLCHPDVNRPNGRRTKVQHTWGENEGGGRWEQMDPGENVGS